MALKRNTNWSMLIENACSLIGVALKQDKRCHMLIEDKIAILANGAKYDVSCSSSGSKRSAKAGHLGNAVAPGICHSWSEDGRCISLLKILMSNDCIYNCAYCVNKASETVERTSLMPDEMVRLTIEFYRRNYIEGLFLSSAVVVSPDETMARMIHVVKKLRLEERFNGYIHMKGIPGCDIKLIEEAGRYVDRLSLNLEIPNERRLLLLAPEKSYDSILKPMHYIAERVQEQKSLTYRGRAESQFVPAGQTSQMMVGVGGDSDLLLMGQAERLYDKLKMKRVYYSAYVPIYQNHALLPNHVISPLVREHRLYQTDFLMRFYGFKVNELLDESVPNLDLSLDPKAFWAIRHLEHFPVELMSASLETLLRVPGIGPLSAKRILESRRQGSLSLDGLKRIGVVMKSAQYFMTLRGKSVQKLLIEPEYLRRLLIQQEPKLHGAIDGQVSLLETHGNLVMRV